MIDAMKALLDTAALDANWLLAALEPLIDVVLAGGTR